MDKFDKTAIVTGAGQGIGRAIATSLAHRGSRLALTDIDTAALHEVATELSELTTVRSYRLDVRDRTGYAEVAAQVEEDLGPVSILVNNAGIAFPETAHDSTYELWDLALGINLGGVINGIQTFLPRMIDTATSGHIVNTASAAGLLAGVGPMYTAAKFGVVGLSESLRLQLEAAGHPIGVTVLCPGGVATNIVRSSGATVAAQPGGGALEQARQRIAEFVPRLQAAVTQVGIDPAIVGEQVAQAINDNELYVLTDNAGAGMLTARTEAILAAMPAAGDEDGTFADFKDLVYGDRSDPPAQ